VIRIKVIQKPTDGEVDGIRLDIFEPGLQYEVGNRIGALMLAEGWAEPVAADETAELSAASEYTFDAASQNPRNLVREYYPPYYDSGTPLAADRRRRTRPTRLKRVK